jgi:hypothetical protein
MKERRRAPRHRCRLRAELLRGAKRFEASLLDVSLSGLSLQAGLALPQGEPVELAIEGGVRVKALAWHTHRLKKPGPATFKIGMMLAEVGPDYEALVSRVAASRPAARPTPAADAETPAPPPAATQQSPSLADLVARTAPLRALAAAPAAVPAERRGGPPLPSKRPPWWRLRLKEKSGTRSRVVTLAAASEEAAVAGSLAEAGPDWEVLEVVRA